MWYILTLLLIPCIVGENLQLPEGSECTWDGVKGRCVSVHRCYSAPELIRNKTHPPICTYQDETPIICCTDCELVQDTRLMYFNRNIGFLNKTGTSKAKDKCVDFIHALDYPCKEGSLATITRVLSKEKNCYKHVARFDLWDYAIDGGRDAEREEYPHMALLGYGETMDSADWLCGGSVISEKFILTAAHCVSTPSLGPVKYVAVGILKRTDPPKLWQRHTVKRIIPHPEYRAPSKYHDIALLETDDEITFLNVLPACLHIDDRVDDTADATGWGTLGYKKSLADNLQSVSGNNEFSEKECEEQYPIHRHLKQGFNHTTQMCYGHRGEAPKDTCEGDSGGPLQSRTHEPCVFTVLGVTSYGHQCSRGRSSGVYTRVRHYVPWIEEIVWP